MTTVRQEYEAAALLRHWLFWIFCLVHANMQFDAEMG
jgi:hypothetical protein